MEVRHTGANISFVAMEISVVLLVNTGFNQLGSTMGQFFQHCSLGGKLKLN